MANQFSYDTQTQKCISNTQREHQMKIDHAIKLKLLESLLEQELPFSFSKDISIGKMENLSSIMITYCYSTTNTIPISSSVAIMFIVK